VTGVLPLFRFGFATARGRASQAPLLPIPEKICIAGSAFVESNESNLLQLKGFVQMVPAN